MEQQIHEFLHILQSVKGYSRNTIEAYRNDLTQFLNFALNERPNLTQWGRVDKPLLLAFILHLKERGYTASSVARKIAVIKSFYHDLSARKLIDADPTATVGSPKVEKRPPQVLSAEEIELLLVAPTHHSTPKGLRDCAILELSFATGLRVSELTALNVDDLNLTHGTVHCLGKGSKRRVIPIPSRVAEVLARYLERGRPVLIRKDERALFVNPHGDRLTRQGLWLIIKDYVKQAGITIPVTPHTLRHSFAVHLLNQGEELVNVQRLLGHASIATTQMYVRLVDAPPPITALSKTTP